MKSAKYTPEEKIERYPKLTIGEKFIMCAQLFGVLFIYIFAPVLLILLIANSVVNGSINRVTEINQIDEYIYEATLETTPVFLDSWFKEPTVNNYVRIEKDQTAYWLNVETQQGVSNKNIVVLLEKNWREYKQEKKYEEVVDYWLKSSE